MATKARTTHQTKTPAKKVATTVAPQSKPLPTKAVSPSQKDSPSSQSKIETPRKDLLAQLQGQFPGVVALALGDALVSADMVRSDDPDRVAPKVVSV